MNSKIYNLYNGEKKVNKILAITVDDHHLVKLLGIRFKWRMHTEWLLFFAPKLKKRKKLN